MDIFKNDDLESIIGYNGLQKSRYETIVIVVNYSNIMEHNLDKDPHITHSIHQHVIREPIIMFPSNNTQDLILIKVNEDMVMFGLPLIS